MAWLNSGVCWSLETSFKGSLGFACHSVYSSRTSSSHLAKVGGEGGLAASRASLRVLTSFFPCLSSRA